MRERIYSLMSKVCSIFSQEKKLISTGFDLVTSMNEAKMVRDCCEFFVEDEQHLDGFMFNRRPEDKQKRQRAKQFLKEVWSKVKTKHFKKYVIQIHHLHT